MDANLVANFTNRSSFHWIELCESIKTDQDRTGTRWIMVIVGLVALVIGIGIALAKLGVWPINNFITINYFIDKNKNVQIGNNNVIKPEGSVTFRGRRGKKKRKQERQNTQNRENRQMQDSNKTKLDCVNLVLVVIICVIVVLLPLDIVSRNYILRARHNNNMNALIDKSGLNSNVSSKKSGIFNIDTCLLSNASEIYYNTTCVYSTDTGLYYGNCSVRNDTASYINSINETCLIRNIYKKFFDNSYAKFVNHSITFVHLYKENCHVDNCNNDTNIGKHVDDHCRENFGFYNKEEKQVDDLKMKYIYRKYWDLVMKYHYLFIHKAFPLFKKYNDLFIERYRLDPYDYPDYVLETSPYNDDFCSNGNNSNDQYCNDNLLPSKYVYSLKIFLTCFHENDNYFSWLINAIVALQENERLFSDTFNEWTSRIEEFMFFLIVGPLIIIMVRCRR